MAEVTQVVSTGSTGTGTATTATPTAPARPSHIVAAFDWFRRNGLHMTEVAVKDLAELGQVAAGAGVRLSPQAQTVATIAMLLSSALENASSANSKTDAPPAP